MCLNTTGAISNVRWIPRESLIKKGGIVIAVDPEEDGNELIIKRIKFLENEKVFYRNVIRIC